MQSLMPVLLCVTTSIKLLIDVYTKIIPGLEILKKNYVPVLIQQEAIKSPDMKKNQCE